VISIKGTKVPVLKMDQTIKFLKTVGFDFGASKDCLIYPYDLSLKRIMMAREALINNLSSKIEDTSSFDVEGKLAFPTFQKYSESFGKSLAEKGSQVERDNLGISQDEAKRIAKEAECELLEDYVVELGDNPNEFSLLLYDIVGKSARAKEVVFELRELWLECNVLHKTATFLRQCFADPVSRALLTDAKDKNSKFARNILMIDIMEAQGIRKGTGGRVNSIEQLVMLYSERETYGIQNFPDCVEKIDAQLQKGLMNEKVVENLWEVVRDVVTERLTRRPRRKRPNIAESKLLEWVELMDPEIQLSDLPVYTRERIDDLDELLEQAARRKIQTHRLDDAPYTTGYLPQSQAHQDFYQQIEMDR